MKTHIAGVLLAAGIAAGAADGNVGFEKREGLLRVTVGGKHFTDYNFLAERFPHFDPLIGPTGTNVMRNYPMRTVEGEKTDHPHHRGLWFTHGDVNGHDFWSNKKGEKIVHAGFVAIDPKAGRFTVSNDWRAGEAVVCTDTRTFTFRAAPDGGAEMDIAITIFAPNGEVAFNDTKEGSMAIRLATSLQVDPPGAGRLVNSDGMADKDAWGRRAAWCDASGPLGGSTVGIAILDHPSNPRHPTGWHARTYGLFAVNPFAIKSFKFSDKDEPFVIPAGKSATFRYRFIFHKGDAKDAGIDARFRAWASEGR
jgi:hypothetical protein